MSEVGMGALEARVRAAETNVAVTANEIRTISRELQDLRVGIDRVNRKLVWLLTSVLIAAGGLIATLISTLANQR